MLYFAKPNQIKNYPNTRLVNVTSHAKDIFRELSPFLLGPVNLYANYQAQNVENGWQFAKLYPEHADALGNPTARYFSWSRAGWNSTYAYRYPMGKGKIPLCTWWNGNKLSYIEARKQVYIPLYSTAVRQTQAFQELTVIHQKEDLVIVDFDVYDRGFLNWNAIISNPRLKMGHGFVLGMLLEGFLA